MASRRTLHAVVALLVLVAAGEALWLWRLAGGDDGASIEIRATNAGVELGAGDGRVLVHRAASNDEVVAEGTFNQALGVPAGRHHVQVLFSRTKDMQTAWLRDLELAAGERLTRVVEFESGELSVEAATGDARGTVVVYVFHGGEREHTVTSMPSGEPVLLAPGVYDLRVVLTQDSLEKDVRWREGVPVQAGLQTRVRVRFRHGALLVRARNGALALPADAVELAVFSAGDLDRELLETGIAGTPIGLPVGDYDVQATFTASNDKPVRWLHGVAVREDQTLEQEVVFDSGTLVVSAGLPGGDTLEAFQAYVYYYRDGDHRQAVAYASVASPVVLEAGRYDARVHFYRSHDRPDLWLRDLRVTAGERIERSVTFASGRLIVRARDTAGEELLGDEVFVRVHAAGERARPVTVARSGEVLTLGAGEYDVLAIDTRHPGREQWIDRLRIEAGRLTQHSVLFERQ